MINILANSLVIIAACVLIGALVPVFRLISQLPSGPVRRSWFELAILIVVLIAGYASYTFTSWSQHLNWQDFIVPGVFFFCAMFVLLTANLSLQTALDIRRVTILEQESIKDPLTGLYNRRYLERRMDEEIRRAQRYDLPLSVLLIDIDYFKEVNDTFGHQIGDKLLIYLSELLTNQVRDSDVVSRYGGDELLILTPSTTATSAILLAERLRLKVETDQFELPKSDQQNADIRVTVSVGVASLSPEIVGTKNLIKHADEALYLAKREGRNRVGKHIVESSEAADA